MPNDLVKMMVVGVGALGRHHARILASLSDVDLVAVADPRPDVGQAVAESYRTKWVADYRECLNEVDAVSIVVPTAGHREVALECLGEGLDVLIEKPLAPSIADGQAIVSAARRQSAVLQVGHIERFNPAFIELQRECRFPKYIRAERLSPYAFRSMDIGAVHDLMIHDIDLVIALANSTVDRVEAFGMSLVGGHEDAVQARLVFRNGCIADLVANRVSPSTSRMCQVWSESGWCQADLATRKVRRVQPAADLLNGCLPFELAQAPGADIAALKADMFTRFFEVDEQTAAECDQLTCELQHFTSCIRQRKQPLVSGTEALAALEVADTIVECVRTHEWDGHSAGRIGPHLLKHAAHRFAA